MSVLTFDGYKCEREPKAPISYDDVVIFRNTSLEPCHISFTHLETFGIDHIGLASQSEILLPFKKHISTKYFVEECLTREDFPPGTMLQRAVDQTGTVSQRAIDQTGTIP
jgi:hypothetical protein